MRKPENIILQAFFDFIAEHLLRQGKRSETPESTVYKRKCAYRGEDGLKCAVGAILPDKLYRSEYEDSDAGLFNKMMAHYGIAEGSPLANDWVALLLDLQRVHDMHAPTHWLYRIVDAAADRGLDPTHSMAVAQSLPMYRASLTDVVISRNPHA